MANDRLRRRRIAFRFQRTMPVGRDRSLARIVTSVFMSVILSWSAVGYALAQEGQGRIAAGGPITQQSQALPAHGPAIPTLKALPHKLLPRSDFRGWCGQGGMVLLGTSNDNWSRIYNGEAQASPLTFQTTSSVQCGDDGRTLAYVDAGSALESDIAAGTTRKLATYGRNEDGADISFSPDLRSVASNVPLTPASKAVNLNVVLSSDVNRFKWSRDSSAFFGLSASKTKPVRDTVQIFNAQHQKIGSGPLPADFLFTDGWFANAQTLYLYLTPVRDEFGAGFIYRCTIAPWKCQQFASNVLDASVGGDGVLAMVRAVGKYSDDGEAIKYPPKYIAEIRNSNLQVVARQTLKSAERNTLTLNVDPSGTRAVFAWRHEFPCPPGKPDDELCRVGRKDAIMIDLSGVLK